jgi:hypothetical protein
VPQKGVNIGRRSGVNFARRLTRVTDDWPKDIPVTEAEIQVFERWFGDVIDELLNPKKPDSSLQFLSQSDRNKP